MGLIRLDKCLAGAGMGTRTKVKNYIRKGQVSVNGQIETRPESKVEEGKDQVVCCGEDITGEKYEYYMLNKPAGCVTATKDNVHETVMDYIESRKIKELFPVGRLDLDTEGLLIITNDGALAHELLSPKKHVEKTYFAGVEGRVNEADVLAFEQGVDIGEEKPTLGAVLEIVKSDAISEVLLTICEGKFHQVKRMFQAVGKEVLYLRRVSMGGVVLDADLEKGEYRPLTDHELELLKKNPGGKEC